MGKLVRGAGVVGAGGLLSVALLIRPLETVAAVIGGCAVLFALRWRSSMPRWFLAAVGILLAGYAFLGRGFAYIGVPPVYVGELALVLGILSAMAGGGTPIALRSAFIWTVAVFLGWGMARTLPYVGTYGLDAVRDGVVWIYGVFAILVYAHVLARQRWDDIPRLYARCLPWLLIWLPLALCSVRLLGDWSPSFPGSSVPILYLKAGDTCVHLAGAGAFLLLGLHRRPESDRRPVGDWGEWVLWLLWMAAFLLASSHNRGGMLAVVMALGVLFALRPSWRWAKMVLIGLLGSIPFLALNIEFDTGSERPASPQQMLANLRSIVVDQGHGSLSGTREWRQEWWTDIVNYTMHGEYRWAGKGYGINLATDDGYQLDFDNESLRSPHNGHLTILARSGIPGLALWAALQIGFGLHLLLGYWRARAAGEDRWARVDLWILSYWIAFAVNTTFDVFLEGPQGGIWFWCLIGFGGAVLSLQHHSLRWRVAVSGRVPSPRLPSHGRRSVAAG